MRAVRQASADRLNIVFHLLGIIFETFFGPWDHFLGRARFTFLNKNLFRVSKVPQEACATKSAHPFGDFWRSLGAAKTIHLLVTVV